MCFSGAGGPLGSYPSSETLVEAVCAAYEGRP